MVNRPASAKSPAPPIQIDRLRHSFKGRPALRSVSFEVSRGSIHGFVGQNGAGKTTTLRICAAILRPRFGRVRVFGQDVLRARLLLRRRIGYMPDVCRAYSSMRVSEYLDFFGAAFGLDLEQRDERIDETLELVGLSAQRSRFLSEFSFGMRQRLNLARTLIHDPELLLLDEPASGLDPRARVELMDLLRELHARGKTIFISSHILAELTDLCDSVTILDAGKVLFSGPLPELLARDDKGVAYRLEIAEARPELAERLEWVPGVSLVRVLDDPRHYHVRFLPERVSPHAILEAALGGGAKVTSFDEDKNWLDQIYLDLTTPGVAP